jgi:type II secretory pathway component PulF
MKFIFKAKDPNGEVREGKVDAISKTMAIEVLQKSNLVPFYLEQEKKRTGMLKDITHLWEGVSAREISVLFRQLATLIEAKVSIVSSFQAIQDQMDNKFLKMVIVELIDDIEDGLPLSESMAKHPDVFTGLMISMIKAGEVSGNLQRSITFIADNTEKNAELTSKIKGALFYPAFIFSAAIIIGFVVFTFVLPKLTGVFQGLNVKVPWYTQLLMNIGSFMSSYWWAVLIVIVGFFGGAIYYLRSEVGKREFDHLSLKIPVFGSLLRNIYISRFAENLSVLLSGGIPIVRALTIVSEVVDNVAYEGVILRAADEVKTGGSMSNVLSKSQEFPPIVSRMIKIGEDAGKISEVLKNVANFYEQETERITRNLASLIEPILIVVLGIGVAILVFAILMPIYNIAGQLQ